MAAPKLENLRPARSADGTSKTSGEERILSVFGYTDFRRYLRDFYEFRKESQHGYSYRSFAKAAGFSSPNFLKLVVDGNRNLGNEALEKFIKALRLKTTMAEYFRVLVKMNQAKDDAEKEKWLHLLKRLAPHANRRNLNIDSLQYLSHWLYPVLREMVSLPDFRFDPYWISRRLTTAVPLAEIVSAWQFLLDGGFIEKTGDEGPHGAVFKAKDSLVVSPDEIGSLGIRNYHRQMLRQAESALTHIAMEEREFGALTFALPSSALDELKYKLKVFRKELHEWAMQAASPTSAASEEKKDDESIIQLNIQMYPHTRKVKS